MNHPQRFKGARGKDKDGKETINISRVIPPYLIAISQVLVGLVVEINVLVYLTSLDQMIDVITRFVTLAAIVNFDNMYAMSLHENKMKASAGKGLKKYFYRNHKFLQGKWKE